MAGDLNMDGQDAERELSTKGTKEHEGQEQMGKERTYKGVHPYKDVGGPLRRAH